MMMRVCVCVRSQGKAGSDSAHDAPLVLITACMQMIRPV
jgi:hypothetical protein